MQHKSEIFVLCFFYAVATVVGGHFEMNEDEEETIENKNLRFCYTIYWTLSV